MECLRNVFISYFREQAKKFEQTINKRFRNLLKDISDDGFAIQDEKNKVWQYVQHYADAKWKDTYVHHLDYDNFTFHLARVFTILYKQFQAHRGKQEDDDKKRISVTVISNGGIDVDTDIPCSFYYMNDAMKRVTLYEPWGCAIDASVVYGITTNTIQIPHVSYKRGRVRPSEPNTWNNLPRCTTLTPNITLTPVKIGEPAYRRLCRLFQVLQGRSDGLVIPYFTGEDQDLLPFPTTPFKAFPNLKPFRIKIILKRILLKDETKNI